VLHLFDSWSIELDGRISMKSVILECVFVLMAFALLEENALARNYLNCLTKKSRCSKRSYFIEH
jgi:hypothetical protein